MPTAPSFAGYEQINQQVGRGGQIKTLLALPVWYIGWLIVYPSETVYYTHHPADFFQFLMGQSALSYFVLAGIGAVIIEAHELAHLFEYNRQGLDAEYRRKKRYVIAPNQLFSIRIWKQATLAPFVILSMGTLIAYLTATLFSGGYIAFLFGFVFATNLSGCTGDLVDYLRSRKYDPQTLVWSSDADEPIVAYYTPSPPDLTSQ